MSFLDFLAKTEPSNARKPSPAAAPPKNEKDMSLMDFLAMGPPASPETSKKPLPAQASVRRLPSQRKSATISGEEEDMMEPGAHTSSMPMVPSGFPEASVAEVVQRLINTDAGGTLACALLFSTSSCLTRPRIQRRAICASSFL